jgi:aminomethyltransferase
MGQIRWHGKDAVAFIEKMVVGDIQSLKPGEGKLSLIMKEDGGIVDDTVITNAGDHIYMVVNGACKVCVWSFPIIILLLWTILS